ncbi:MAG: hypothetical protein QOG64_662 [Acidimicrobiaceae bacterium]|nr:hypothetical protein [Acidimicrobiaceae bacterium]
MRRTLNLLAITALLVTTSAAVGSYTLRRGDSLGGVARRLGVSVDALARANGIRNPDRVAAGRVLKVPAPVKKTPVTKAPPAKKPAPPAPKAGPITAALKPIVSVHIVAGGLPPVDIVRPGDTASKIATRNHVKATALAAANPKVNLGRLTPGVVLSLPLPPVWVCPVQGGGRWYRDDWGAPRADTGFHQGNDIIASRGAAVVAPVGGTLELRQGKIGGNAFYVYGDDGHTYYGAHLDSYSRGPGRIESGQTIGGVGDTGDAKGGVTHLHFEFHPNHGAAVDPFFTLEAWC